jgi:uncharacterized protein
LSLGILINTAGRYLKGNPSPLTYFLVFALALLLALVAAAILSPGVQALLAPVRVFPLHRIFNRLTMICLLGFTTWLLLRAGLGRRDVLGYAMPKREFLQQLGLGLVAGLGLMLAVIIPLFVLELRVFNERLPATAGPLIVLALRALLTGASIALIEETFFRGAMQGAMSRGGSTRAALFAVPLLYGAIHFFGEATRVPHEQVTAHSGWIIFAGFFRKFAEPAAIAEAFVALYLVGLLLALLRQRTGGIAACIGLHAGFVAVITLMRRVSSTHANPDWQFLVGPFDGLLGAWIAVVTLLACIAVWRWPAQPKTA